MAASGTVTTQPTGWSRLSPTAGPAQLFSTIHLAT